MTMLRVLGLSMLAGSAATMLVWFGWALIANLSSMGRAPAADGPEADGAAERGEAEQA
jgi:hypothetical protein